MPTLDSPISNEFLVPNHIWIDELAPDYPLIQLSNSFGNASVALHGAHVTNYTPTGQKPVIFTSDLATYKEGKAIRGGIPICWPWFNAHPSDSSLPSHGYARVQFWEVVGSDHTPESTSITLTLTVNELKALVVITLTESLEVNLTTTNISEHPQTVGGALHSYFTVSNIDTALIRGLEDVHYLDTLTDTPEVQDGEISITEETDRIYLNSTQTVSIFDPEWNRNIFIDKSGSQSTVIWNPWIAKSSGMADLGNEEYRGFVCIESANALEDVYLLTPGETHTLSTKITSV
ncbi:MAG: D-hexose-6-phosphate mutarotase [Akkermansiaceae bacterium]